MAGPSDTRDLELLSLKTRLRTLPNAGRRELRVEPAALARGYRELLANAPRRRRAYLSSSRSGEAPIDPTGRRGEERLAMAWFNAGTLRLAGGDPVSLLDYQFPLKAVAGDQGIGKIDLLGYRESDDALTVVELKVAGNQEDRRIGLVESLIYAAIVEANAGAILREVEATRGHRISGARPKIMLVAPREFWRSGHPSCEALVLLAGETAALLETDLAGRTPGIMDEWGCIKHFARWDYWPLRPATSRTPTTMTVLHDRRHEGGIDYWTEQQPLPSVAVCRLFEQAIHGCARVAPWRDGANTGTPYPDFDATLDSDPMPVTIEIWREFGLSLGERHQKGEVGPMFSAKACIKVLMGDVIATPLHSWTMEGFDSEVPVALTDGSRWTACRLELNLDKDFSDCWIEPIPPTGEKDNAVEHYYFSHHPVNAWTLRRILDRSEQGEPRAESLIESAPREKQPRLYRFSGEIGRRFEAALASGALEASLCTEIDRLKTELQRYLLERRDILAEQDDQIAARWRTERPSNAIAPEED